MRKIFKIVFFHVYNAQRILLYLLLKRTHFLVTYASIKAIFIFIDFFPRCKCLLVIKKITMTTTG